MEEIKHNILFYKGVRVLPKKFRVSSSVGVLAVSYLAECRFVLAPWRHFGAWWDFGSSTVSPQN